MTRKELPVGLLQPRVAIRKSLYSREKTHGTAVARIALAMRRAPPGARVVLCRRGVCMHSAQTATRTKGDDGNRRARLGRAICVRAAFLALVVFVLDGQAAPFGSVRGGAVSLP